MCFRLLPFVEVEMHTLVGGENYGKREAFWTTASLERWKISIWHNFRLWCYFQMPLSLIFCVKTSGFSYDSLDDSCHRFEDKLLVATQLLLFISFWEIFKRSLRAFSPHTSLQLFSSAFFLPSSLQVFQPFLSPSSCTERAAHHVVSNTQEPHDKGLHGKMYSVTHIVMLTVAAPCILTPC